MWGYASVRCVTGGAREHPDATSKSHQARMYWGESGRKSRTPALASSPSRTGHQRRDVAQRGPWGWGREGGARGHPDSLSKHAHVPQTAPSPNLSG